MGRIWTYIWFHHPSDIGGESQTFTRMTRLEFLEMLNRWNRESGIFQQNRWLYFEK